MSHTQQLKCVIRGLPTDFDHTELMQELRGFGFDPNHISLLKNKKTNTNMPLFLVTLPKNPDNQGIFNITNIGVFRVHAEPLNKSNMPPQCYRCQEFYHHSRFCNRAPRCLKCSGGHLTSDCKKPNKTPAKCSNCSGPHPANFSGCPKTPKQYKQHEEKKQPMKNVWQEKPGARAQNSTPPQQLYSAAVKKNTKHDFDVSQVMSQMMTQWGQMLSYIQSKI
ncbi:nucleic-acid-binding protein from transposon X-element [Trichonephila clavipes]|nr:nucleic-acid-binding protein from transposon X-element [Trichonephila clavipes]